jgi:hypothetical protein
LGLNRRTERWRGVFLFFSNRLGCLGSLLLSVALSLVLLALLGLIHIPAGW